MTLTLGELAVRFGCELRGEPQRSVTHVAALTNADASAVSFLANPRLSAALAATQAGVVVLDSRSAAKSPVACLVAANPHAVFARIAQLLHAPPPPQAGVHTGAIVEAGADIDPTAAISAGVVVERGARIGARALIGPGCIIGRDVIVGADCRLAARVTLEHGVRLGQRVNIQAGAVVGSDGFGYARDGARWLKVPQIGAVVVGDDVEIGANTTIDRGAIDDTVIAEGVKLDNLIQIAHNVHIGAHTAIAACTGVSGSTRIGARCMIGGGCGLAGHIEICDDVVLTAMSGVSKSIRQPGIYSGGIPAQPASSWRRIVGALRLTARSAGTRLHEPLPQDQNDD